MHGNKQAILLETIMDGMGEDTSQEKRQGMLQEMQQNMLQDLLHLNRQKTNSVIKIRLVILWIFTPWV
jgi:hypothetical protein